MTESVQETHNYTRDNTTNSFWSAAMQTKKKNSIFDYLRAGYMISTILITSPVFGSFNCILLPFVLPFDRKRRSLHRLATLWAQTIVFLNPWWKFRVTGRHHLAKTGLGAVYVANHQSQADILAIFMLNTSFRWLSKDTIFKIPLMGWGMWATGYVSVKRGQKKSHEKCMKLSEKNVKNGIPMVFFPEGTRSKTGKISEFKTGAFRLAKSAGVPIIPVTVDGCAHLLPKNSWFPQKAKVNITVHAPIDSTLHSLDDLVSLAKEAIMSKLPEEYK